MTNHDHEVKDMQDLVKQIVQLREQMNQVEEQKQRAQEQVNALSTQLLSLKAHMKEARNLLDHCLDTGEDVTTVKLTKTVSELNPRKQILTEDAWEALNSYTNKYPARSHKSFFKITI